MHGQTPVMFAAIKNSKSTVKMLLDAKADATVANYARACVRLLVRRCWHSRFTLDHLFAHVLHLIQDGHTAKQVARGKSYHSIAKMLPEDPNKKGCVLL